LAAELVKIRGPDALDHGRAAVVMIVLAVVLEFDAVE